MKRALVAVAAVVSVLAGLLAAIVAALWFSPAGLLDLAARAAAGRGIGISAAAARGTPGTGWTIDRLHVAAPAFALATDRIRIDVDWRATLTGHPALDALWIEGLDLDIRPSTAMPRAAETPSSPVALPPIADARFSGTLALRRPGADSLVVDDIDLRAHLEPDSARAELRSATFRAIRLSAVARYSVADARIGIERLRATGGGLAVAGDGSFILKPFSGTFELAASGPLEGNARFTGERDQWRFSAEGRRGPSRMSADGHVDLRSQEWRVRATALGIPADMIPGAPAALGAVTGRLEASGTGTSPAALNGRGRLSLAATNGPAVEGNAGIESGNIRANVRVSSGGVRGTAIAAWNLERKTGSGRVDLALDSIGLRRWLDASADGQVRADVDLDARPRLSVQAELSNVQSGGKPMADHLSVGADGKPDGHRFVVSVSRGGVALAGEGSAAWASGRWRSDWRRLEANLGQAWRLVSPFRLIAGGGTVLVSDLRLASEAGGTFRADGGIRDGRIIGASVTARGLLLEKAAALAGIETPVAGTADIDLSAAGELERPRVDATGAVRGLSVGGRPAGDASFQAHMAGGRLVVTDMELTTAGGRLSAAADVPLAAQGRRAPPFHLRLRTAGLDPEKLPIGSSGLRFEEASLKADIRISGRLGRFSADGWLDFDAARVGDEDKQGVSLSDVHLRLVGDGSTMRVVRGSAKGGDGSVTLSGFVAARENQLDLTARNLELRHASGVSLRLDSDLALRGSWEAPVLEGDIEIRQGEIRPAPKKKDARPEPPAARRPPGQAASPLAADVSVTFDSDVWYRDGQTAIELKGQADVRKERGDETRIFGTVETIRGDYYFYGRPFAIEEGRVTFTGEAPADPRLQVKARHVNEATNVQVWIEATGRLRDPRIALTSQPPMEETDIISVLVTGRPLGADGQGPGTEAMARSLAANYLAEKVRQQVQDRIAIDVLKLRLDEAGGADVTIGERVTDDLYISYGQTLGTSGERRVTAEYEVSPRFSLQGATSSVGRYVLDLLFRFGFY